MQVAPSCQVGTQNKVPYSLRWAWGPGLASVVPCLVDALGMVWENKNEKKKLLSVGFRFLHFSLVNREKSRLTPFLVADLILTPRFIPLRRFDLVCVASA